MRRGVGLTGIIVASTTTSFLRAWRRKGRAFPFSLFFFLEEKKLYLFSVFFSYVLCSDRSDTGYGSLSVLVTKLDRESLMQPIPLRFVGVHHVFALATLPAPGKPGNPIANTHHPAFTNQSRFTDGYVCTIHFPCTSPRSLFMRSTIMAS